MKTIAVLLNRIKNGGAQKATITMCNHLIKDGYNIVIFMVKNEEITFNVDERITVIIPDISLTPKTAYLYFKNQKNKYDIDMLITPMHFDITYLRLLPKIEEAGIRTVVFEHASYLYPLFLRQDHHYFIEKLDIYKKISCLCCVGGKDYLFWSSVGVERIVQLDNPIESSEEITLSDIAAKNILFVGRLQQDKNILFLIDNIKDILLKHSDWKMFLVGAGNQEKIIRNRIVQYSLQNQIILEGYSDNPEKYYEKSSIFVLASPNETFSYALYEAKIHGLPSIVPNMPFNKLITETKGHILFNNAEEFKNAVEELIENDLLRNNLSIETINSMKNIFTWNHLKHKYIDLIEAIISNDNNFFNVNTINNDKTITKIQLDNIFNEIFSTLSWYLSTQTIVSKKEIPKNAFSKYSQKFDVDFPLGSIQRKAAVSALYLIKNIINGCKRLNNFLYKGTKSIIDFYYKKIDIKKGIFCVDWNTMPELKNSFYDKLDGRKYYFQTGAGKSLDFKTLHAARHSELIITSSETQWLKNVYKGQKRMFINHACGAFKRTGIDMDKNYNKKYGNYDYLVTSSKYISGLVSEAFQTKIDNIYPLGIPRTDRCFNTEYQRAFQNKFYQFYPKLIGKKIYIFSPTFRLTKSGYTNLFKLNFQEISTLLKNEVLLISLHPHVRAQIKNNGLENTTNIITNHNNILLANEHFSTFDLSIIADTIITDYSSVIFEAMLMDKKIGFYAEDHEKYERGFYFDYLTEGPSPVLTEADAQLFVKYVRELSTKGEAYARFKKFHVDACDGHSTERVLSFISEITKK